MTNYYYLASNQQLRAGNASLDFLEAEPWLIPGFDYPVQREIFNGVEKDWALRELLQYIQNHFASYECCTVQVAHLINSNLSEVKVQKKSEINLDELINRMQLLLEEGHLLTIKKG